jgi:hypothetical protein
LLHTFSLPPRNYFASGNKTAYDTYFKIRGEIGKTRTFLLCLSISIKTETALLYLFYKSGAGQGEKRRLTVLLQTTLLLK